MKQTSSHRRWPIPVLPNEARLPMTNSLRILVFLAVARSDSYSRGISSNRYFEVFDRHQGTARWRQVKPIWQAGGGSGSSYDETARCSAAIWGICRPGRGRASGMKRKTNREEKNLDELDLSCRITAKP